MNCLVCVGKLLEHLDKWLVLDEVLPFLPQIPSREPAVLMGILGEFTNHYGNLLNNRETKVVQHISLFEMIITRRRELMKAAVPAESYVIHLSSVSLVSCDVYGQ